MELTILCLIVAAVANAVMDKLQFHGLKEGSQFWDPSISWKNKYKNYPEDKRPRFPGATTFLVFLTDGWHLMKFIMLTAFIVPLVPSGLTPVDWLIAFILLRFIFGLTFHLFFHYYLNKPNNDN